MSFTVEDGTGLSSANAYAAVAFVDDYHADRGNTKWTGTTAVKQSAIIRATDYVDKRFRTMFRGTRASAGQALEWPRVNAANDNGFWIQGIPTTLKKAIAEYALRALLYNVLIPDAKLPSPQQSMVAGATSQSTTSTGVIVSEEKSIGPITKKVTYAKQSDVNSASPMGDVSGLLLPAYPEADLILQAILKKYNTNAVVRA